MTVFKPSREEVLKGVESNISELESIVSHLESLRDFHPDRLILPIAKAELIAERNRREAILEVVNKSRT